MDRPITTEEFHRTISEAVLQRSTKYSDAYALSFYWERDDTNAYQDVGHFQSMLSTLRLAPAREIVLKAGDVTPGWTVQGAFTKTLNAAKQTKGRAVVIVHYAGHGAQGSGDVLNFVECTGGRRLNAMMYMVAHVLPDEGYYLQDHDKVNVLFVFDCCYSWVACRAPETSQRVVEVIAATKQEDPMAFSPPRNTITAKLAGEIKHRERNGHRYVEFAEVIASLAARPDAVKPPSHGLRAGVMSICLPFSGITPVEPQRIQPAMRAVFGVHISENLTEDTLNSFVSWIRALPENASMTLEGVYPTRSTLLVLCGPLSVWNKLNGVFGYSFMAKVTGGNQMRSLVVSPSEPGASGLFKENIPPRRDPPTGK